MSSKDVEPGGETPAIEAREAAFDLLRIALRWHVGMSSRQDVVAAACAAFYYFDGDTLNELAGLTRVEAEEPEFPELLTAALRELDLPDYSTTDARKIVGRRITDLDDTEFERAIQLLTRHSPRLFTADTEALLDGDRDLLTSRMGDLGRLVPVLDDAVLRHLLADVESLVADGGHQVRDAVCTGFLEAVTSAVERDKTRDGRAIVVQRIRPFLGPRSLEFLRAWDRFHGTVLW